ncbi:MAG TPA: DUF4386 domain-containing protein [Chthoniobacterales bacterium]|nr:DUF4386 domain-containing protein [Chthoniobacterales bacterium]
MNDPGKMQVEARIAGALYWMVIAGGLFAGAVQGFLTVPGDPAATAQAIAAHEALWRWGIGVHLVYLAFPAIIMDVLLYRIFKPVEPTLALLALASALTSGAVEGAALLQLYVPLVASEAHAPLATLGEGEGQALAYLAIRLYETGSGFALLFFSGFCAAIGALILRSRLVPRAIGGLMLAAGICYFVSTLSTVVAPALAALLLPWILLPCFFGEASLATWLLVKGVDMPD